MISNNKELIKAVKIVDENMQLIQNYLGNKTKYNGRIRFPRNYIRTARHFRKQLLFVSDETIRDNLVYASIQTDVYLWLLDRTKIYGVARAMTIKSGITLISSICETLAIEGTKGIIGKKHSYCERCNRMVDKEIISDSLRDELQWLWNTRAAIHIYEIDQREHERYSMHDYNRAVNTAKKFRKVLEQYHS